MPRRWWDLWPGRLEHELEALGAAGIPYEQDNSKFKNGRLVIKTWPTIEGERLDLIAEYPELYPYFRFEVQAPGLDLPRHQQPFNKNLCLVGRATANWKTTDTLADFISQRLPQVLKVARNPASVEASELEEHQGEPFSDYYSYQPGAILMVDSSWKLADAAQRGKCSIGLKADTPIRGAILSIADNGTALAETPNEIRQLFARTIEARWIKLGHPIRENDSLKFQEAVASVWGELAQPRWNQVGDVRLDVVAVAFPEELGWRQIGLGWVFLVRHQRKGERKSWSVYLARAGRAGEGDLAERSPEIRQLRSKVIAVFGAGALGALSVAEMARAGSGEIRVLDHDYVDPATVSRWPLGLEIAGLSKTEALQRFVRTNYPYTRIAPYTHRLGATGSGSSDLEVIDRMLSGADLVYDATAEWGIQHFLSDVAMKYNIPCITVSATYGGWGGLILRIRPGKTEGCWSCLQHRLTGGSIASPSADAHGEIQTAGCADPTFTGTGFDLAPVALGAVRLAVGTLCGDAQRGYPDVDWDVAVISLRDDQGGAIAPSWQTYPLTRHPECEACANR
jgi:molybdopterin/thiamine biosynthesis adenylyltransferase